MLEPTGDVVNEFLRQSYRKHNFVIDADLNEAPARRTYRCFYRQFNLNGRTSKIAPCHSLFFTTRPPPLHHGIRSR